MFPVRLSFGERAATPVRQTLVRQRLYSNFGWRFVRPAEGAENPMGIIEGILKTGVTLAVIFVVMAAIAALFMIVFGIATGIDEKIQE
jgi:uncharacterized YccA/Bax inhibitor family protein